MVIEISFIRVNTKEYQYIDAFCETGLIYNAEIKDFDNTDIRNKYSNLISKAVDTFSLNNQLLLYIGYLDTTNMLIGNDHIPIQVRQHKINEDKYQSMRCMRSGLQYAYNINENVLWADEYYGNAQFANNVLDGNNIPIEYIDNDHVTILYDQFI